MKNDGTLLGVKVLGDYTQDVIFELQIFAEGAGDGTGDAGAQAAGAQAAEADPADQARREAFEKAITENKDLYEERLKQQLDRRMKSSQRDMDLLKGQNARYNGLAQAIAQRYGIDATDMDGLEKAVREDQSWLEEQAARNGLTVEQQKHMNELEAKNREFQAAREAAERQARKEAVLSRWQAEADELKGVYPDFDLTAESANQDFVKLLGNGVAMRTAYEVVHHDELVTGAMQYAVQRTAGAVADSVRANGLRPVEGAGTRSAPSGVSARMTKTQREDIERRVLGGERITL